MEAKTAREASDNESYETHTQRQTPVTGGETDEEHLSKRDASQHPKVTWQRNGCETKMMTQNRHRGKRSQTAHHTLHTQTYRHTHTHHAQPTHAETHAPTIGERHKESKTDRMQRQAESRRKQTRIVAKTARSYGKGIAQGDTKSTE